MINALQRLGMVTLLTLANIGQAAIMFARTVLRYPFKVKEALNGLIDQLYAIGVFSLPIIIVSGLFIGMVVGLQGQHTLEQ